MTSNEQEIPKVLAFRHARRRSWLWFCFSCVEEDWRAGKFHDPVVVSCLDLEGVECLICGQPLVPEDKNKESERCR